MRFINTFLFIICSVSSFGQSRKDITAGTIDSIYSNIMQEPRQAWIYLPESAKIPGNTTKYPVIYLLDGDAHFLSLAGMIQQLSTVNGNTITPEMIVVGIPNTNRMRDLTPSQVLSDPPMIDSSIGRFTGGGTNFLSFIEKELMPYVEKTYPASPYKIFIGHSLGGLMVMDAFINRPHMFNSYVAIDPSMWWDKQSLYNSMKKKLNPTNYQGKGLYLAIANTLDEGMDTLTALKDTSLMTGHFRAILEMNRYIRSKGNSFKYAYKYYPADTHGSVPLIAEYDALRFLFDFYSFNVTNKDFLDSSSVMVEKIEEHYKKVTANMGYTILPPENFVNGMGYQALSMNQMKKAERLFSMNVRNFPNSGNAYDSMGDYFKSAGDKKKAIEYYKRSLQIAPNPFSEEKIKQLESQ